MEILLLIGFVILAMGAGKMVAKLGLPGILGWLMTGMIIGPHALNFMNSEMISSEWFHVIINICEVTVGMMVGSELIISELKKSGKQIGIICLFEGLTTFVFVTAAFYFIIDVELFLALMFGAIALATAPAPSLSIVKEYNANGPVAKTLIPLAALDDILAILVFFVITEVISANINGSGFNLMYILMMILLPMAIGSLTGFVGGKILKNEKNKKSIIIKLMTLVLITSAIGIYVNKNILPINLFLAGIPLASFVVNMVDLSQAHKIFEDTKPIIGICLVTMILNLGAPLDYKLIMGAGSLTAVYIIVRALGKLIGTYVGGKVSGAEENICKYLGFAMLPHSGVSLVFTGIVVGILSPVYPEYATMIQGTIAAAAVINEIIAVILAKQAFKLAGEINSQKTTEDMLVCADKES